MSDQDALVDRALREVLVPPLDKPDAIKANFSAVVVAAEQRAHALYREAEREAGESAIRIQILKRLPASPSADDAVRVAAEMYVDLNRFFLSRAQSRKSRGGSSLEMILRALFRKVNCPFTAQPRIDGRPDFVLPSESAYRRNAMDCIVLTAKRTVRERWRQIVTEGAKGLGFFLATLDDAVTSEQLTDMLEHRIRLVVPFDVKHGAGHYRKAANVLTFEDFLSLHVAPAIERWRQGTE